MRVGLYGWSWVTTVKEGGYKVGHGSAESFFGPNVDLG